MVVTRKELTDNLSKLGLGKKLTGEIIDQFFKLIVESLKRDEEVRLVGFGKFFTKNKKEIRMYNPRKKEYITIPERTVVKFAPSKQLKKDVKVVRSS